MPETVKSQPALARERQSWMLASLFAGMGIGFVLFWVTLDIINAGIICAIISLVVWPLSRDKVGRDFATKTAILFFVATVIGILVGLGSTVGSGLPLAGP